MPCICTMLRVHRQPWHCPTCNFQPFQRYGSLRSMRGPTPAPPFNNMTRAVAIDRLVCALPWVCTIFCVHRQPRPSYGSVQSPTPAPPFTNMTPTVATKCPVCAPPCVRTTLCMHHVMCPPPTRAPSHVQLPTLPTLRLATLNAGTNPPPPFNYMTRAVAIDRLVSAPPRVCTILCVPR